MRASHAPRAARVLRAVQRRARRAPRRRRVPVGGHDRALQARRRRRAERGRRRRARPPPRPARARAARERHAGMAGLGLTAALLSWVVVLARGAGTRARVAASEAETDAERQPSPLRRCQVVCALFSSMLGRGLDVSSRALARQPAAACRHGRVCERARRAPAMASTWSLTSEHPASTSRKPARRAAAASGMPAPTTNAVEPQAATRTGRGRTARGASRGRRRESPRPGP